MQEGSSSLMGSAGVGVNHLQDSLPPTRQQLNTAARIGGFTTQGIRWGNRGQQGPLASPVETQQGQGKTRKGLRKEQGSEKGGAVLGLANMGRAPRIKQELSGETGKVRKVSRVERKGRREEPKGGAGGGVVDLPQGTGTALPTAVSKGQKWAVERNCANEKAC